MSQPQKKIAEVEVFNTSPAAVTLIEVEAKELSVNKINQMIKNKIIRDGELLSPVCDNNASL